MSIWAQRCKTIASVSLVLITIFLLAMPAIVTFHDYISYRGVAQGEIVGVEYRGQKCAAIVAFQVEDEYFFSKSTRSINCRKAGMTQVHYSLNDPRENSQSLGIAFVYSILFTIGVLATLSAWMYKTTSLQIAAKRENASDDSDADKLQN